MYIHTKQRQQNHTHRDLYNMINMNRQRQIFGLVPKACTSYRMQDHTTRPPKAAFGVAEGAISSRAGLRRSPVAVNAACGHHQSVLCKHDASM